MPLQPVHRRSVPDEVFDQLVGELVQGQLGPGESLPSERRLAEVLGVSRPAVREALQRLAQAGLVDVRQGDATTVRDFRRLGGLDLLPRLLVVNGSLDLSVARSIVEARAHIGPKIAELAARRGDADDADALDAAALAIRSEPDRLRQQHLVIDYWNVIVDAARSITFRLMFNSMFAAYEPTFEALVETLAEDPMRIGAYEGLAHAIRDHDAPLARERAERLLAFTTDALMRALDALEAE